MIGQVIVMEPAGLRGLAERRPRRRTRRSQAGEQLFTRARLRHLPHAPTPSGRGPTLAGVFGKHGRARAAAARSIADESYLRESILNPQAKIVAGLPADHADVPGQVSEEQLLQLIAYIKSLQQPAAAAAASDAAQ